MQATDDRHMQKSTVWGTGEITGAVQQREQMQHPFYTVALNTGSAEINGQLVAQTKSFMYTDFPRGPILKWIPASPPQPTPSSQGFAGYTDPAFLNPLFLPRDQFTPMGHSHMDFWQICRHHLVWIILLLIVATVFLQWGNTQRDPFSKAERGLLKEVEK